MNLIQIIIILLFSLTLHELMHALVSDWLGDTTARHQGRISLNPLAHIDPFMTLVLPALLILAGSPIIFGAAKPVPFTPWLLRYGKWGVALVAVSGPLTNLAIAAVLSIYLHFVPLQGASLGFLVQAISINVAFFVFNMIPFPPLDGSRVLYAVVPRPIRDVMDKIEGAGMMALFLFMFVGFRFIAPFMNIAVTSIMRVLIPGIM
jgi:Zn-dependent protease